MSGILVIKFGALGDMVQATGPFAAIRKHHAGEALTLLTTPPYVALARALQLFDDIWDDGRPKSLVAQLRLIARLRRARFDRVYDLQTSQRSSFLLQALWPRRPEWSGIARGATHPHANPRRDFLHTIERQAEQLRIAGVPIEAAPPNLSALAAREAARLTKFALPEPYALLVPGGSPHRPGKRWPAQSYAALAARLAQEGLTPAIIGGPPEREIAETILAAAPGARSLVGQTDFLDILALGSRAALAVGNDTGPMHLIAAAGAPALVLFGRESDPVLCAPRGANVHILRPDLLAALPVEDVVAAMARLPAGGAGK
ncbi:MAG: glycosyltransferase family 9 protein [Alphaproteobacteria bacterium]